MLVRLEGLGFRCRGFCDVGSKVRVSLQFGQSETGAQSLQIGV